MIETKVAIVAAASSAVLASTGADDPVTAWTQLGVAGAAMGILFWIVSRRDPKIAEINAAAVRDAAEQHAIATKEAAETHANAMREFAAAQREENRRQYDLLIKALHTTPPGQ